jgi:hypothetical protein
MIPILTKLVHAKLRLEELVSYPPNYESKIGRALMEDVKQLQKNTMAGSLRWSEAAPFTALLLLKAAMYNSGKTRPT